MRSKGFYPSRASGSSVRGWLHISAGFDVRKGRDAGTVEVSHILGALTSDPVRQLRHCERYVLALNERFAATLMAREGSSPWIIVSEKTEPPA